jgi:hypothetical protein
VETDENSHSMANSSRLLLYTVYYHKDHRKQRLEEIFLAVYDPASTPWGG